MPLLDGECAVCVCVCVCVCWGVGGLLDGLALRSVGNGDLLDGLALGSSGGGGLLDGIALARKPNHIIYFVHS